MIGLRMTTGVLAVLGALLERPGDELYGLEIVRASGLEPGTIYPILQRLRTNGWVNDRWEDPQPAQAQGRPPRRYYRLTIEGRARAIHALQHGRDRSGLSRLLTPPQGSTDPTTQAGPRGQQALTVRSARPPGSLRLASRLLPGDEGPAWAAEVTSCLAETTDPEQRRRYLRSYHRSLPQLLWTNWTLHLGAASRRELR